MSFERWINEVKRDLIDLGVSESEASSALDEDIEWFEEQFEEGRYTVDAASDWLRHQTVDDGQGADHA